MKDIYLVIKKEIKNFLIREAMVKWYIMICCINILFTIVPGWDFIPFTRNRPLFAFTMMLFSVFLVPNTLSLDTIGGEKYHKTLESIISTPISIKSLLYGKALFILLLGIISLMVITALDNIILELIYDTNFLSMGMNIHELLLMYVIVLIAILIIGLLGAILTLVIKNLKLCGYLLTFINLGIIVMVFKDFKDMKYYMLLRDFLILFIILLIMFTVVTLKISKQQVMKYLK